MNAQHQQRHREQQDMDHRLARRGESHRDPVRIEVAQQQHHREKDQAGRPYRGRSAQGGQQLLRRHRFHDKEQKRAEEDRDRV